MERVIRDDYTNAKSDFIKAVTKKARGIAEKMDDFFVARLDVYEDNMLNNVEGLPEGYFELAKHIPTDTKALLDLGCGTGLELDEVFRIFPDVRLTGIDLARPMLKVLTKKFAEKSMTLICASYLGYDFGEEQYDCAISFETMHHWTHNQKFETYKCIRKALKPGGRYIECDYMVETQSEEDHWLSESKRIRVEQNLPDGIYYHIDIPFAINTQIKLLSQSGFVSAEMVWRKGATTIIIANK
jgi:2-polyprenyl-3-methyl-5-hydroxy-6-metoxy-1,4-benzoquinol methylase